MNICKNLAALAATGMLALGSTGALSCVGNGCYAATSGYVNGNWFAGGQNSNYATGPIVNRLNDSLSDGSMNVLMKSRSVDGGCPGGCAEQSSALIDFMATALNYERSMGQSLGGHAATTADGEVSIDFDAALTAEQ